MDTHQIDYVLKHHSSTKPYYKGTYASDQLPREISTVKQCYVVNTDPSNKTGSHWVAFYFEGGKGEFFDSYGNEPSFYSSTFTTFLQRNSLSWVYNTKRVQGAVSTVCGQYCIYYIMKRCRDQGLSRIMSVFGNDYRQNDQKINDWFNQRFDSSFPMQDVSFILKQVAQRLSV